MVHKFLEYMANNHPDALDRLQIRSKDRELVLTKVLNDSLRKTPFKDLPLQVNRNLPLWDAVIKFRLMDGI